MMQAEMELLELGKDAIPILATLFAGEARNEFGVPYRNLGLPLRCAIEVARRLESDAKPLEPYLLKELKNGSPIAAMALGSLGTLDSESVEALALSLDGDVDVSYEAASALIRCGECANDAVRKTLSKSLRAANTLSKVKILLAR